MRSNYYAFVILCFVLTCKQSSFPRWKTEKHANSTRATIKTIDTCLDTRLRFDIVRARSVLGNKYYGVITNYDGIVEPQTSP